MKKFLIALFAMICATCCFVGCKDETPTESSSGGNSAVEQPSKNLSFALENDTLELFSTKQLDYNYENIVGKITFDSSEKSVVTVDEVGCVTAIKKGTSVITVSGDGLSDTITITVGDCDKSKLELFYEFDTLNLYETYEKEILPVVLYDGKVIDGGVFSFDISTDGNATVNGNVVKGVSKGLSVLTIGGTINGETLDGISVTVNVLEKVEVVLTAEETELFVFAGSQGQQAPTELAFAPVVKINDAPVADAEFTVSYSQDEVATYENGVISAVGVGEASITFAYTSAKDTTATASVQVRVDKPLAKLSLDDADIVKNRVKSVDYAMAGVTEIREILYDGENVSADMYALESGVLKLNPFAYKNVLVDGERVAEHTLTMSVESKVEKFVYTQTVLVTDFAIGTVDEWNDFRLNALRTDGAYGATNDTQTQRYVYAVLTANIDASEKLSTGASWAWNVNAYFHGELDGNGYTVSNITLTKVGLFWGVKGATVKNIGFVNVKQTGANNVALLYWNESGANVFENVYVQGEFTSVTGTNVAGLGWTARGRFTNVVLEVQFHTAEKTYYAISGHDKDTNVMNLTNVFVVSSDANTDLKPANAKIAETSQNYGLFESYATLKAELAKTDGVVSSKDFDDKYWDKTSGVVILKTAKEMLSQRVLTLSCHGAINGKLKAGTHTLSSNFDATYTLTEAVAGVTISGNQLEVLDTVEEGGVVSVTATYTDTVFGYTLTQTQEYVVSNVETVAITYGKNVGLNRAEGVTIDVTSYAFADATVTGAVLDGATVVATLSNDKLTVSGSQLKGLKADSTISVLVKNGNKTYEFKITDFTVYDYLIGTKAEFIAWATAQSNVASSDKGSKGSGTKTDTVIHALLDANIDLTGEKFTNDVAGTNTGFGNGVLNGSFDGQGYTVNGLEHDRKALFYNVSSTGGYTIKNVAFTNVVLSRANGSVRYFFAGTASGKTTLENVYLQVVSAPNSIATTEIGITNDCGMLAVKNCVFDFAFTYAEGALAYTKVPIFRNRAPQYGVENCIAITKTTLLATGNALTAVEGYTYANYGVYESTAKVAEAVTANTISLSGFSGSYWTTTAGYPVWKNK